MNEPLAFKLRPSSLEDVVGQQHLVGPNGFIRKLIENKRIFSLILFGPPGTGKTTVATILASSLNLEYRLLNATINNKKDMEEAVERAKEIGHLVVIMDEVHRLNKDKQDYLLPHIESGLITLIGATTANPYHSINQAIRSRCHLVEFYSLKNEDIVDILKRACKDPRGLDNKYKVDHKALEVISRMSNGDVRYALNQLEIASLCSSNGLINLDTVNSNTKVPQYLIDEDSDGHYDAVSALQKSIRGSDVDASLYYLARLLASGDLDSIERRLSVTAWEDIGLANPNAVVRTMEALRTARMVGLPEAIIPLGVVVVDLALSPKSKSGCLGIEKAMNFVEQNPLPVPDYLHYTPTGLKSEEKYPYDREDLWMKIQYLPEQIKDIKFYEGNPSSAYEKALLENKKKIDEIVRSSNIKELRKKK